MGIGEKLVEGPKKDVTGTTKQALIVDGKYRLSVSIVVPVLNEIEVLPYFWESLRGVIEWTSMTDEIRIPARIKEVIFVDGGSTDGTLNFLEDLRSKFNDTDYGFDITILHQPNGTKLAYGEFLGIASANSDLIIKMDGDLQHNPSFIPEMMRNSSGNDIVIASRYIKNGGNNWNPLRGVISRFARFETHALLPRTIGVNDPLSGFFMIRRGSINLIQPHKGGYKLLMHILANEKEYSGALS